MDDNDVTHLLEAKHGEGQRGRAQELLTILKGTETVAALTVAPSLVMNPRELFYATLRAADKPLLDDRLKDLQAKAVERDQKRHRPRERDSSHERGQRYSFAGELTPTPFLLKRVRNVPL